MQDPSGFDVWSSWVAMVTFPEKVLDVRSSPVTVKVVVHAKLLVQPPEWARLVSVAVPVHVGVPRQANWPTP